MKKIFLFLLAMALVLCCCKQREKEEGFAVRRSKTEVPVVRASEGVPIDLENKGIGPIKRLEFAAEIDEEMAARGEARFGALCMSCHMVEQRMIGPAMQGIYERRSPEWVMNIILNPDEMLKEDPIAKALLREYNNAIMLNQNLTEGEARDIAEYLRTL